MKHYKNVMKLIEIEELLPTNTIIIVGCKNDAHAIRLHDVVHTLVV